MANIGARNGLTGDAATTPKITLWWSWWRFAWGCIGFEVWRERVHLPLLAELRELKRRPSPTVLRVLRGPRGRFLLPHRMLVPLTEFVRELGDQMLAVGVEVTDERWTKAGAALLRAAALVRDAAR